MPSAFKIAPDAHSRPLRTLRPGRKETVRRFARADRGEIESFSESPTLMCHRPAEHSSKPWPGAPVTPVALGLLGPRLRGDDTTIV